VARRLRPQEQADGLAAAHVQLPREVDAADVEFVRVVVVQLYPGLISAPGDPNPHLRISMLRSIRDSSVEHLEHLRNLLQPGILFYRPQLLSSLILMVGE
jgi:hypothetical protein